MADRIPNVAVYTHENRRALFYDDLLRGKLVMINFMSIQTDGQYRMTEKLAQVQRLLGARVGRDVFLYSITADPEHDTPSRLKALAEEHGAGPGWLFLTGEPEGIEAIRASLFHGMPAHQHGSGPVEDCSAGLIRYGNEAIGLWGSVPARLEAGWIAQRISWIEAKQRPAGSPRRRGPDVLAVYKSPAKSGS